MRDSEESNTDALTGVQSHRMLPSTLDEPMAAILFDIDDLRSVNYHLGHSVGDDVLVRLGAWLSQEAEVLRGQVFRVAGDKFLLLLRGRTLDEALTIANTIVSTCPSLRLPYANPEEERDAATVSAAVFTADPELPLRLRTVIDQRTEDLYRAELAVGRTYGNVVVSNA